MRTAHSQMHAIIQINEFGARQRTGSVLEHERDASLHHVVAWSMESRGNTSQRRMQLFARTRIGRQARCRRRCGRMSPGDPARPPFVSLMRKARAMRAAAQGGYSMCHRRTRECHPSANDIRYASPIPRSFMDHTRPACAARNSAAGVSSLPGGRKANGRLHLSEWLSAIDREGERGVGLSP